MLVRKKEKDLVIIYAFVAYTSLDQKYQEYLDNLWLYILLKV